MKLSKIISIVLKHSTGNDPTKDEINRYMTMVKNDGKTFKECHPKLYEKITTYNSEKLSAKVVMDRMEEAGIFSFENILQEEPRPEATVEEINAMTDEQYDEYEQLLRDNEQRHYSQIPVEDYIDILSLMNHWKMVECIVPRRMIYRTCDDFVRRGAPDHCGAIVNYVVENIGKRNGVDEDLISTINQQFMYKTKDDGLLCADCVSKHKTYSYGHDYDDTPLELVCKTSKRCEYDRHVDPVNPFVGKKVTLFGTDGKLKSIKDIRAQFR
uniref:Uncharacterized protein n=1 Tax=viral metagenome TaxID=1070528 RepID=A0A6C0CKH6_9ZZZZ